MKVTTEALERCETLLTVEIDPKQEKNILQKAAKKIARQVRIPGFRPGKAPYNVVVRRFGAEAVQQEALEASLDKLVQDALKEADVTPYAQIGLDNVDWNPLIIKVKIPTEPVVELNDYRSIRLDFEPVEVTDEDVEETLASIQEQNALWTPVERPSQIGDMVDMAVVEKDGDEILSERESDEFELDDPSDHEGHDHPDLTTPLLELSAGDEKTFNVTYPEAYQNEDYAGKEITFEVKINSVKEKEVDPIDDEFAQAFSDFDTLEEFKADIRQKLQEQRKREQAQELGHEVIDEIVENSTIDWPKAMEDASIERELQQMEREMQNYGLTMDAYYQMQQTTKEVFAEEIRERVAKQIERSLVLSKVVELENLKVGEGEILERAKLIADQSGGGDQVWRNILASPAYQNMITDDLLTRKAMDWLAAIARGEDPQVEEEAETDDGVEAAADDAPDAEVTAETDPGKEAEAETESEPLATEAKTEETEEETQKAEQ